VNPPADDPVLLYGGVVYSPVDPFATAMVVAAGQVAWVGSDSAAQTVAGPGVRVVDLRGALVTPAFVDAHAHLTETGLARTCIDLRGARSAEQVLDAVAAAAAAGRPLLGHGWDDTDWAAGVPTRAQLDRAGDGAPVYLSRVDVHSALVSSRLVDRVPGVAQADGWDPSGPLTRTAHALVRRASRDTLTRADRRALQAAALAAAAAAGIGQVHEMAAPHVGGPDDLADLLAWTSQATGPRVVGYWGALQDLDLARALGARGCAGDLCIDGALGSRTAALREPYADAPSSRGAQYLHAEAATAHVIACTRAGMQAGFHAIGDAAVTTAVEAFRGAAQECGRAAVLAARHRLEHAEMLDEAAIATLADLGVVASVQPAFDAAWGGEDGMYARRLGVERVGTLNPFAALSRAGVMMAFGSDSPVTPLDPWGAVRAAARHHVPSHRLTARAAFSAHTRGGWRAAGRDDGGVLAPGAPADYCLWEVAGDLVVQTPDDRVAAWSTDPRAGVPGLPDLDAPSPRCLHTVVGGRSVHMAADAPGAPG
jgi:predicted amidohydrolase YtcJ